MVFSFFSGAQSAGISSLRDACVLEYFCSYIINYPFFRRCSLLFLLQSADIASFTSFSHRLFLRSTSLHLHLSLGSAILPDPFPRLLLPINNYSLPSHHIIHSPPLHSAIELTSPYISPLVQPSSLIPLSSAAFAHNIICSDSILLLIFS